jgi:hypothetical protein
MEHLSAETESNDPKEAYYLLILLKEMQLIEGMAGASPKCRLTARGWERVEELSQLNANSAQAFVAMWFTSETDEAYAKGIHPAVLDSGYDPLRIDSKEHSNKIDDEIVSEIRRSRFMVADFSCEPKQVRGGVYYEAGYAQGMGMQVIWTCRASSIEDLHFDTRQYNHITWATPEELYAKLRAGIGALLGQGPFLNREAAN